MYLRMPDDLTPEALEIGYEPGGIYPMQKVVYGRIDAPRLFTQAFKAAAAREQWVEVQESILVKRDAKGVIKGVMLMHMDDLFVFSDDPVGMLKKLDKHFKMGSIEALNSGELCVYTGLDFKWIPEESRCEISQGRYLESINTGLTDKQKKRVFGAHDLKKSEASEVRMELEKVQQAWAGVLGWACKTQPQLSVVFSEGASNNTTPSDNSVLSIKRSCEYAKATHRPLVLTGVTQPAML